MKKICIVVGMMLVISGCQSFNVMGKVQAYDNTLAKKYGIPVEKVVKAREILGIPDIASMPDKSRVLPAGWMWKYELLDAQGKIVDTSQFHWDTFPKVIPSKPVETNAIKIIQPDVSLDGAASLENLLQVISANPDLLKPAQE